MYNINYMINEKIRCMYEKSKRKVFKKESILNFKGGNYILRLLRKVGKGYYFIKYMCAPGIYIEAIAVVTSYACDLNCKGCGQHTPQIKLMPQEKKQIDIEKICKNLDKISNAVDGIAGIALASGEGFLNVHLETMIKYVAKNKKYFHMNIPTNATVIPRKEILELMKENKVSATITRYPNVRIQRVEELIKQFEKYDIEHTVFENRVWFDIDLKASINCSEREVRKKYRHCERQWMLINNELWKCVPLATAVFCGEIKKHSKDYINVEEATVEEIRSFIIKKGSASYLQQCMTCRGMYGKDVREIPAAKQI